MAHRTPSPADAGLTLIELMVTIAIAAILIALAVPSFHSMILNNRLSAQDDALISAMNYARGVALSTNAPVTVCPLAAAGSSNCGASWTAGWIVVGSAAGQPPLTAYVTAAGQPVLWSPSATTSVSFDTRGLAGSAARFVACDVRGAASARSIQVLPTGFVQAGATAGKAVWDGSALSCP